ncbi:MAG: BtpA/SgcQ family protein, partial [Deltaproteobacteria bacterium]|nr:BtpA/SgcQ family protein [Deltaproteobacteria bacterium]
MAKKSAIPSLVGVVHLPPLPGAPRATGSASAVVAQATRRAIDEARALERAGFDALVVENFGDAPFYKTTVPPVTVAAMSAIACAVRAATRLPLGINVLRNDGFSALAIALVSGASFIRVNVLSGIAATDQGLIEGEAARLLREREATRALGGPRVAIWGDALVKHARTLSVDDVELAVEEVGSRSLADAVIVTGATTGRAIGSSRLEVASHAARKIRKPLYLGSGVTPENAGEVAGFVDGVIVGSALRRGGLAGAPLETRRLGVFE